MRGFTNTKPLGEEVGHAVNATIPTQMRPRIIFVLNRYSPYYVGKLNAVEKNQYILNIEKMASKYQNLGITSVAIAPAYLAEDFCDRAHFSYSGGQKLAASLAPYVKQKAKELGYE